MSKFQHLVVDTSAFIKNVQLQNISEMCYTVQGVLDEIRNDRQMKALAVLPYHLLVKQPDPDVLAKVVSFSKQTGDFATLSLVDLQVIALTYELETRHVGRKHLQEAPKPSLTISSLSTPDARRVKEFPKGFYVPERRNVGVNNEADLIENEPIESNSSTSMQHDISEQRRDAPKFAGTPEEQIVQSDVVPDEHSSATVSKELVKQYGRVISRVGIDEDRDEQDEPDADEIEDEGIVQTGSDNVDNNADTDDDDDDGDWITPDNIAQVKLDYGLDCLEELPSPVACITTDFAMQNVLKQIGLQVAALDGRVIRESRTYILRCYACFKTTPDATKVFCPRCGNRTLKKVAVSLDANGQQVIHINSRRPLTAKYKNRPLAKFTGGKHSTNPLLYEDQPLPQQRISAKARSKTNVLRDDYTAGYSPFVMRDVDSRSAMLRGSANLKQWMTNCEYDNKRRGYRK